MKILMLSKGMLASTYQRMAAELAVLPNVDLTVAVPPVWYEPGVGPIKLERGSGKAVHLAVLPMWLNGHFHLHFYPGLKRLVEYVQPDILHISEESFNLATFQAMRLGVQQHAQCCFYNSANIDRRYPPPFSFFERYTLTHAAAAFAVNHEAARIIRKHGYARPVHVVPEFGVDPDLFYPAAPRLLPKPFRIGFFGRMIEHKGVLDLVEAMAFLPHDVHLLLIGDGALVPRIKARITKLDLQERVAMQPRVPSSKIPEAMRQLHAFVLPSRTTARWKEQFGRVLIEAMASGVPTIGSDSGAIPEVIGDAGLIFHEGNVADLAAKIQTLVEQPRVGQALARKARQQALDLYASRTVARRYYDIYCQMLELA